MRHQGSIPTASAFEPRGDGGFSLIEVIMGLAVVVVASLAVANATVSSLSTADLTEKLLEVETAVRETMESARAVSYRDLESLHGLELYRDDDERDFFLTLRVSQLTPIRKSLVVEVFEKWTDAEDQVIKGRRLFRTMAYRSER